MNRLLTTAEAFAPLAWVYVYQVALFGVYLFDTPGWDKPLAAHCSALECIAMEANNDDRPTARR